MPNNFDEASAATQDMFAAYPEEENGQAPYEGVTSAEEEAPAQEEEAENTPVQNLPDEGTAPAAEDATDGQQQASASAIDQAAQTAEIAVQVASQKDSQLQQAQAMIEALKQQNQQLQGTIDEMSRQNTEKIMEDAISPPTLDINGLAFADEETVAAAQAKFAADMAAYNRRQIMGELAPAIEYAKAGMREKEKAEAISALSKIPELAGIDDMLPQLDRIIENNKWLQSEEMPMDEKYINAFAMAKGVNSINTPPPAPKEPTAEELMELYNANPAFQEMIEKQRLEQIKQSQQVPQFSASSGAANAALNIKEKPQTLEEASKRTREMFGSM